MLQSVRTEQARAVGELQAGRSSEGCPCREGAEFRSDALQLRQEDDSANCTCHARQPG